MVPRRDGGGGPLQRDLERPREEVFLKETVQDAGGEWVERPAKLELQILARGN
jgi:hypothetical protein